MAYLKNCSLKTSQRYPESNSENYHRDSIPTLEIEIPLPGGTAKYEIDLPPGMKENLEFAAQLSEKR